MTPRPFLRRMALTAGLALAAAPAAACKLSLVLALDVSASVDAREYDLQQEGLARALTDPEVVGAVEAQGGIWLSIFEWSGARHQYEQLPWTFVAGGAALAAVAGELRATPRQVAEFPTSLGYALGHALNLLKAAPETCDRQVIDVSGDGVNNDGFPPASAYVAHDMSLVTVNGLVITDGDPTVVRYYLQSVIQGPGAFVQPTNSYNDYEEAMRRKLLRELGAFSYVGLPTGPQGG
ncbi:DUF1194 domain-containing protein [Maritimibacter alkaliphilus]|uniref:Lipoprotein n=1 Tax=Maritimibacter alkaliphilus HTCC2654 TaxID=314271 RepID=A3VAD9_9RHOB|nr:DUF1194 domain-containing protein [Maritimibacter alkaliphilus]EAQ14880.1 hypothetical protein RB2654_19893 [Maritimibacter alkaliphilus HTCC2654]